MNSDPGRDTIRPHNTIDENQEMSEGVMFEDGGGQDDDAEEGQKARFISKPCMPSKKEVDQHNVSHVPYRNWCPHCVKGKRKGKAHFKKGKEETCGLSKIHADYLYFVKTEDTSQRGAPSLAMLDSKTGMIKARVVNKKGLDEFAIKVYSSFVKMTGHKRVLSKVDNENPIKAVHDEVKR